MAPAAADAGTRALTGPPRQILNLRERAIAPMQPGISWRCRLAEKTVASQQARLDLASTAWAID